MTTNLANLILPGKSFTEKISKFINIEGRYQLTKTATSSPTSSKEDWSILYAILEKTNLLSFIKMNTSSSSPMVFNLFDPTSFIQKIEMEPFYGLSMDKNPSTVDLNLNNYKSTLMLLNSFKDLNLDFFLSKELDEKRLKAFSELNFFYPEIYELNIQFTKIVQDLFKFLNNIAFFGVQCASILQSKLFYYKFVKDSNFLLLFEEILETLEMIINCSKDDTSYNTTITIGNSGNALDIHLKKLESTPFSLILLFGNTNLIEFNYNLYEDFNFVFNYLKKPVFVKLEKLFKLFPELLKQCYIDTKFTFARECFYSFYSTYKTESFDNTFYKRYETIYFFDKPGISNNSKNIRKSNMFFEGDRLTYIKTLFESFIINHIDYKSLQSKTPLNYANAEYYYKYDSSFNPNIWIKLSNKKASFSLNEIHSVYIGDYTLNKISYQSGNFKHLSFPKVLQNIVLLENKFLPSSKFDNFYLMDDFSKFSILMKHCSDVFLERSSFKK